MARHKFVPSFGVALWSAVGRARMSTLLVRGETIRVRLIGRRIPAEITLLVEGGAETGFLQRLRRGVRW